MFNIWTHNIYWFIIEDRIIERVKINESD